MSDSRRATVEGKGNPPTMKRSMRQIATAYAPGALFTWEGGLGACRARSVPTQKIDLNKPTQDLIREQIQEALDTWLDRGRNGSYPDGVPPEPERFVDGRIMRHGRPEVTEDKLAFCTAQNVGYEPFPLAFVCKKRECSLHRSSRDPKALARDAYAFKASCPEAKAGGKCIDDWEQLDVVMVHWSGDVQAMTPERLYWDVAKGEVTHINTCRGCGGRDFRLLRPAPQFSQWLFECTSCRQTRRILMADEFTYGLLGPDIATGKAQQAEVNMEAISYRASAAYYPQSDRTLVFKQDEWLNRLQPGRVPDLHAFLGEAYGYPGKAPSDAEKEEMLRKAGLHSEWVNYQEMKDLLDDLPASKRKTIEASIASTEARWAKDVFKAADRGSSRLLAQCAERGGWVRRYDPIRMAAEHRTLVEERIRSHSKVDGKDACVDVCAPDLFLVPDDMDRSETVNQVKKSLELMGISEMKLIRNLDVCEYSFGYTRVSASPTEQRDKAEKRDLPVRLNMFDRIPYRQRQGFPVYCLNQENEAFYVRLDENVVRRWLETNGMPVGAACPSDRIGGLLIESYSPFSRFLDEFRRERTVPRSAYPYVYTLLHTMAHQFIGVMAELSGLDLGSFGEHLFAPDLAFLVYRRGMTMDLGNLSSMWRNHSNPRHGNGVLQAIIQPDSLRCGAETICMDLRGGACPGCIMIPENACLTRNELLSRSVLIGRGTPRWDDDRRHLTGFYEVSAASGGIPT